MEEEIIIDVEDYKYHDFSEIKNDLNANFIVILDHIEDPRNFGAIIRTAECAGVDYIIIPNKRGVEVTPTVMKTSSGALVNSKIVMVSNLKNTIDRLKELNYWVIGTDAKGTTSFMNNDEKYTMTTVLADGTSEVVEVLLSFKFKVPLLSTSSLINLPFNLMPIALTLTSRVCPPMTAPNNASVK